LPDELVHRHRSANGTINAPIKMPGTLFVVATPIGNLEDITLRALRVLREVAVIAAEDTRRTAHLLARHAIATPMTSLHEHNETRKTPAVIARLLSGESIALVSDAGTPTISDPGGHLIREAIAAGIRVETIPGPSAAMAAIAVSGMPTESFTFLGFPPARSKARTEWFDRLRATGGTVILFEAPHRIRRTLEDLKEVVGDCDVVVARELTKAHEELVRGPITAILAGQLNERGEFVVIVNIGLKTEYGPDRALDVSGLMAELGAMTNSEASSKRQTIAALGKRHGMTPNEVYQAIETAKKSGL
jgi:16S rRNA (cytidine1402-2'-O)-methyltransferase